jgi:hypothetical protein
MDEQEHPHAKKKKTDYWLGETITTTNRFSTSRNCVIPAVRVRTLGSVGSRTQLSLRCNFSDYVLRNNYMFRPIVAIFRLSWEYLRATVSYIARIM